MIEFSNFCFVSTSQKQFHSNLPATATTEVDLVPTAVAGSDLTNRAATSNGQVPLGKFNTSVETTKNMKTTTDATSRQTEKSGRSTADIFLSSIIPLEQTTNNDNVLKGTKTDKNIQLSYFISLLYIMM